MKKLLTGSVSRLSALADWEAGRAHPTVKQLRTLGQIYGGYPLAIFYLPDVPVGPQPVRDHRRIWGESPEAISPRLRREIDIADDRRVLALELLELQSDEPPTFRPQARIDENPNAVAARFRRTLGIELDRQLAWGREYDGFQRLAGRDRGSQGSSCR